jgi:hypothetical protein
MGRAQQLAQTCQLGQRCLLICGRLHGLRHPRLPLHTAHMFFPLCPPRIYCSAPPSRVEANRCKFNSSESVDVSLKSVKPHQFEVQTFNEIDFGFGSNTSLKANQSQSSNSETVST